MRILLVGKHRLMSRFIESHILYQEPLAQVTIATPWQLREISGIYDLIILNNISLQDNPDQAVASLEPYVEKQEDIVLLNNSEFIKPGDKFISLSPADDPDEFNRILKVASGRIRPDHTLNSREFMTKFTLACRDRETLKKLTTRQIGIVQLILSGMSYQQAADELNVTPNTIKKHMSSVYKKTGLKGKGELFLLFRNERVKAPKTVHSKRRAE